MAVFVFLATSTGTRVVASNLGNGPFDLYCSSGLCRPRPGGGCLRCPPRGKLTKLLVTRGSVRGDGASLSGPFGFSDFHVYNHSGYVGSDVVNKGVEDIEALQLIFEKRIFLSVGAKVDCFTESLQFIKVVLPLQINLSQVLEAYEIVKLGGAHLFDLSFHLLPDGGDDRLGKVLF